MKRILFTFFVISLLFTSCSKDDNLDDENGNGRETLTNPWKDYPYKLNVIYFVPNDLNIVSGHTARISKILLDAQDYFADNMEREGFGRKSFGLDLINDQTVNIITIRGQQGKVSYPEEDGDIRIENEILNYYQRNPNIKKHSEHYLVIIPSYNNDDFDPLGGPYFEVNRFAYVMDFKYLDMDFMGKNDGLTEYNIGSVFHELGHTLGSAHDEMRPSLERSLGTSLMGDGNNTYGYSTTSLTGASTVQLSKTQTFSTVTRSDWYNEPNFDLTAFTATLDNNNIKITGNFTTDKTVKDIVVWHDAEPFSMDEAANNDYDAISWNTKTKEGNNFELLCSLNEFNKKSGRYEARIGFLHDNGSVTIKSFVYRFENNRPVLNNIRVE